MNSIYIFWYQFNGLEFVTYIIIPVAIVLVILVYIYFNIKLIKLSFDFDLDIIDEIEKTNEEKLKKLKNKFKEDDIYNEATKEKV